MRLGMFLRYLNLSHTFQTEKSWLTLLGIRGLLARVRRDLADPRVHGILDL